MPAKPKLVAEATEPPQPPAELIPQAYAPTISAISALIAVFAFIVAFRSNRRSARTERLNRFEREYGSELRQLTREFDDELANLNAYVIPSGRPIRDQKDELAGNAAALEERSGKIARLLGELDEDESIFGTIWCSDFLKWTAAAEQNIAGALEIANSQPLLFERVVTKAQADYQSAIRSLRRKLRRLN